MKVDSSAEKMWQLSQSTDTKTKNLEQHWKDLATRAKEFGFSEDEDNPRAWIEKKQKGELVTFRSTQNGLLMETFVLSLGRMSTSTYSSAAPWSWTSESDFQSDHDLTLVLTHKEVSLGLRRYLSEKEMVDQSLCPELPDKWCGRETKSIEVLICREETSEVSKQNTSSKENG